LYRGSLLPAGKSESQDEVLSFELSRILGYDGPERFGMPREPDLRATLQTAVNRHLPPLSTG
jgi:hypothetical protein